MDNFLKEIFAKSTERAKYRFWMISDLQQGDDDHTGFAFSEVTSDRLGEEKCTFEIDSHDKIKTFFSHFKDIRTDFGRNSGIVDKRIKCSEIGDHIFEKFFAVFSA